MDISQKNTYKEGSLQSKFSYVSTWMKMHMYLHCGPTWHEDDLPESIILTLVVLDLRCTLVMGTPPQKRNAFSPLSPVTLTHTCPPCLTRPVMMRLTMCLDMARRHIPTIGAMTNEMHSCIVTRKRNFKMHLKNPANCSKRRIYNLLPTLQVSLILCLLQSLGQLWHQKMTHCCHPIHGSPQEHLEFPPP